MAELDPAAVANTLDYLERAGASLATLAEHADEPGEATVRERLISSVHALGGIIGDLERIDEGQRLDPS
jgi:hypothetical protein